MCRQQLTLKVLIQLHYAIITLRAKVDRNPMIAQILASRRTDHVRNPGIRCAIPRAKVRIPRLRSAFLYRIAQIPASRGTDIYTHEVEGCTSCYLLFPQPCKQMMKW